MNEKHKQLYDMMVERQLISKSYEDFTTNFSKPEKQKQLYGFLVENEVMSNNIAEDKFYETIFGVKKKDKADLPPKPIQPQQPSLSEPVSAEVSTESTSDTAPQAPIESGDSASTQIEASLPPVGVKPVIDVSVEGAETQYLDGAFGDMVNAIPVIGDVFDDAARAWGQGQATGDLVPISFSMAVGDISMTEENIQAFVNQVTDYDNRMREIGVSDEAESFAATQEANGGGAWGFLSAAYNHPQGLAETLLSSTSGLINKASAENALATVVAGTGAGAATGLIGGPLAPVTSSVGAAGGAALSLAPAMGMAGATVEMAMSFVDFLKEELGEKDFSYENVLPILQDESKLRQIRKRSALRSGTIGLIDGFGGAVLSKGAKAAKAAGKTQARIVSQTAAGEVTTGVGGELLAQVASGQDVDVAEALMEGSVGVIGTPVTLASAALQDAGRYKVNGGEVSKKQATELVEDLSDDEVSQVNIEIDNDADLQAEVENKKRRAVVSKDLPKNVSEEDRNRLIDLEMERQNLKGKETLAAETRLTQVENDIRSILEKERVVEKKPDEVLRDDVSQAMADLDSEIEKAQSEVESLGDAVGTEAGLDVDQQKIDDANLRLKELKDKKSQAQKLIGEMGQSQEDVVDSKAAASTPLVDMGPLEVDAEAAFQKEQELRSVLDIKEKAEETPVEAAPEVDPEVPPTDPQGDPAPAQGPQVSPEEYTRKLEEEGVYIKGKGIRSKLDGLKRRFLSARSFMPKSMFAAREQREASIAKQSNIAQQNIREFNRLLKGYDGDQNQLMADFDDALRGGEGLNRLNDEFAGLAQEMRNQIDALSIDLINLGVVPDSQVDKVIGNLGQYLTRSFEIFTNKDWKDKVSTEVKNEARNFLREQNREMAMTDYLNPELNPEGLDADSFLEKRVEGLMNKYLDPQEAKAFAIAASDTKNTNILKQRKDIPKEILALMGEYTDPAQNYAASVLKMAQTAEGARFLNTVKENGKGVWLFEKATGQNSVQIASEGSEAMAPLNGMYTTPEIAAEFNKVPEQMSDFMKKYMAAIGSVKWAKTIGSIGTHSKNVLGNLGFMWANGHSDLTQLNTSYQAIKADLAGGSKKLQDRMNRYIELGIVKQSAALGEIRDMFKDADMDSALANRMNNENLSKSQNILRKARVGMKKAENLYQAEDDFFKIVAFENERNRYAKAQFGVEADQLTTEQAAELDTYVAEVVKNTYPTYSRVPEAIQMIRRFPFMGNFVSFQAESYRVAWNTMAQGISELKSDNAEIRKIGAQRLGGASSYVAAKASITGVFAKGVGAGIMGVVGKAMDEASFEDD